jgi:uncharacterized protein YdiU (UPF0061 family)
MPIAFDNTYARLPDRFFARVDAAGARAPTLLALNHGLTELLGFDPAELESPDGVERLAGNRRFEGSEPIALAYAGHQFGSFVPRLGDGRALLLGEIVGRDGARRDLQLKGSGRTPFSRGGDGRAALGPVLREYLVSEAMAALGVPTTRSLAAVATGERVFRETALPGAVLARVAASHLRVGTFQYFATRGDEEAVRLLVGYALARHYPDATGAEEPALALLDRVIEAQARLVARWIGLGFVHGVMNTDNTAISGETLDYGPCAFLDEYDPNKVFSSIDHGGRYAFSSQPRIALWNCARLAEALLPLIAPDEADAVRLATARLERFGALFGDAEAAVTRAKLGLGEADEGDGALAERLFALLAADEVDFTLFFRRLTASAEDPAADAALTALVDDPAPLVAWLGAWRERASREPASPVMRAASMRRVSPAFIPRNHRIEEAIAAAVQGDLGPFHALRRALERPCDDQPELAYLAEPPAPEDRVRQTFCGT